jgi:uridine phosphorylase
LKGDGVARGDLPIANHPTEEGSLFLPENLLERASFMMGKERGLLPRSCLLDFDDELGPVARERFGATPCPVWSCFHTVLFRVERDGMEMGLIGGTVGAPYAVLVAEQLIASGCRYIVGYSSSGAVSDRLDLPCFVVPDRALRDEGTSYHYLPPATWAHSRGELPNILAHHATACGLPVHRGATWTIDAPYRETQTQIELHRAEGILAVEMEAAALMALAEARNAEIASLLHVTNALATGETDFQKGPSDVNEKIIRCCFEALAEVTNTGSPVGGEEADGGAQ